MDPVYLDQISSSFKMTYLLNQVMLFANALLNLFEQIISGPSPNQWKYNLGFIWQVQPFKTRLIINLLHLDMISGASQSSM